jgi:fatty acid desaturase
MSTVAEAESGGAKTMGAGESVSGAQFRGLASEAREMATLTPGVIAYNFGYLALVWAIAIGAMALVAIHPAWYTIVFALLVVSSRQQALLNCEHEAIHGKFVRSRRWNDFIGRYLCAAPVGSPYAASRHRHLTHHRLLGTPDDPDKELHSGESKKTRKGLARHFVGGLLGGYAGMILMGPRVPQSSTDPASRRRDIVSLLVAQVVFFAFVTLVFEWWIYPLIWLLPLATVTVLTHLVRSFVEHAITDSESGDHSNRLITIRSNFFERALIAPFGMNYHAEHHLLPSVPAPRLKKLQARLSRRQDTPPVLTRTSYAAALRRYARELRD